MIVHTNLTRGLFFSNHASNYLPLRIRMPEEKEECHHGGLCVSSLP
jgi:hypothetical protein